MFKVVLIKGCVDSCRHKVKCFVCLCKFLFCRFAYMNWVYFRAWLSACVTFRFLSIDWAYQLMYFVWLHEKGCVSFFDCMHRLVLLFFPVCNLVFCFVWFSCELLCFMAWLFAEVDVFHYLIVLKKLVFYFLIDSIN